MRALFCVLLYAGFAHGEPLRLTYSGLRRFRSPSEAHSVPRFLPHSQRRRLSGRKVCETYSRFVNGLPHHSIGFSFCQRFEKIFLGGSCCGSVCVPSIFAARCQCRGAVYILWLQNGANARHKRLCAVNAPFAQTEKTQHDLGISHFGRENFHLLVFHS